MGFSQGISGLSAAQADLDVIGNNISNSSTTAFKKQDVRFEDIYAQAQIGLGVGVADIRQDFSSGTLSNTGNSLDMGIDGNGFFRMQDDTGQTVYSRDGSFTRSADGRLVNSAGSQLTGYNVQNFNSPTATASVNAGGEPEPLQIPTDGLNARATSQASLPVSLNAGATAKPDAVFDAADSSTFDYSTPNTIYDSLGNSHSLNTYFTKTGENQWRVNGEMMLGEDATLPRSVPAANDQAGALSANPDALDQLRSASNGSYQIDIDGTAYTATVSNATDNGQGQFTGGNVSYTQSVQPVDLSFTSSGNLLSATGVNTGPGGNATEVEYALNPQNGSAPIQFGFDFAGSSQTAQDYAAGSPTQNGYASGALTGLSVQDSGIIRGIYDNGQQIDLAQASLASFANNQGLDNVGGNNWRATAESGQPALGVAGTGDLGSIRGGSLEDSNVELSDQLVQMIESQRTYQANAQTITTQSEILQTAVNLG